MADFAADVAAADADVAADATDEQQPAAGKRPSKSHVERVSKRQGHVPAVALLTKRHSWQSAVAFDKTNVTACARHGVCKRNATACVWQWHQDVIDATAKRPQ